MTDLLKFLKAKSTGTIRLRQKIRVFWLLAESLAELSTCRRAKVGCVVLPSNLSGVLAVGYNGPCRNEPNNSCSGEKGQCGCVHAEANAVTKLMTAEKDCVLLTTTVPCHSCAGLIINCNRVAALIVKTSYRDSAGLERLQNAGITVISCETVI